MPVARDMALNQRFNYQGPDKIAMSDYRRSSKLAVILHADIAGSTAMVQRDEVVAHERIKGSFRRFSEIISSYQGCVRELRGDALVAQFERASDAVSASLSFQENQVHYNDQLDDDIIPELRVGIALGEVVIDDHIVTGAGVVLAQRVEQLAVPNGLCITAAIHEALPKRLPFDQEDLGDRELKGFGEMIRVYRVVVRPGVLIPPPDRGVGSSFLSNVKQVARTALVFGLIISGGAAIGIGYEHISSSSQAKTHWLAPAFEAARKNPVKVTTNSIELGASVFRENCVSCHGENADGSGLDGRKLSPKPANLHTISRSHADGEFAYKIRVGRGAMPGWGETLDETEIWSLVNYIRSLDELPVVNEKNSEVPKNPIGFRIKS